MSTLKESSTRVILNRSDMEVKLIKMSLFVGLISIYMIEFGGLLSQLLAQPVGSEVCQGCHEAQYQHWLSTAHAKADQHIPREQKRNPHCKGCHIDPSSVGGGHFSASHQKRTDLQGSGVGCEACHGLGGRYVEEKLKYTGYFIRNHSGYKDGIKAKKRVKKKIKQTNTQRVKKKRRMKKLRALGLKKGDDAVVCARCHQHSSPHLLPFDLNEALEEVRHPQRGVLPISALSSSSPLSSSFSLSSSSLITLFSSLKSSLTNSLRLFFQSDQQRRINT